MKANIGVSLQNRASLFLEHYSINHMIDAAVMCDELGIHSVWAHDSLLAKPRYQPLPILAAVAARTKKVKLASGIVQPHLFNNPLMLALEWTTIDVLSQGRTIMAVGLGAGPTALTTKELEAVGIRKEERGKVFEESIEVIRRLWSEPEVTHHGKYYTMNQVSLGYRPVQQPHPPIWIAAGTYRPGKEGMGAFGDQERDQWREGYIPGPLDRVARLGDGWITSMPTPEEYKRSLEYIRETAVTRYGRNPDEIEPALNCWINVDPDPARCREEARQVLALYHDMQISWETVDRWTIQGDAEACVRRLESYVEAGARTFHLVIGNRDQVGQMRIIGEQIVPAFQR